MLAERVRRHRSPREMVVLDYSNLFVMPGLQDVHTHLAYGNAKKSEEDIDLYQPMEFRSLCSSRRRCWLRAMPRSPAR